MSVMSSDASVLAQILADVRALSATVTDLVTRIAVVEQLLRESHSDHLDHETRLRTLEQERALLSESFLPRKEYESDRANRSKWLAFALGAVITVVVPIESLLLYRVFSI